MHSALYSLLEYRNSCAPINRLPAEVLARIFSYAAAPGARQKTMASGHGSPTQHDLGWIRHTFVCRKWRHVALDHATLWVNVDFALGYRWATEMISRAKSAPLIVDRLVKRSPWQADLIVENIPRIAVLRLETEVGDVFDTIIDGLSVPVPLLKVLCIKRGDDFVHFPDNFLGDHAPNLHTLEVRNPFNFPWSSSIFQNLVSFQLIHPSRPRLSLDELFSALSSMPRLERLVLQNCLRHNPTDYPDITIKLPCLRYFQGGDDLRGWTHFLQHLTIPATALRNLTLYYYGTEAQINASFASFIPTLVTFVRAHGNPAESISRLVLDSHHGLKIIACRAIRPDYLSIFVNLHPVFWTGEEQGPPTMVAAAVLPALSSEHLRELDVGPRDTGWSPSLWLDIMARAPGLQSISVEGQAAEMLCIALQMSADATSEGAASLGAAQPSVTLLPALRELSLTGVDFTKVAESTAEYPSFQDCLAARAKERMLQTLVLQGCKIRSEWVDDLRRVVCDVQWEESSIVPEPISTFYTCYSAQSRPSPFP
ncbi:hypothetical protein BV25DRAFT_1326016 [Artomyces pyxidatus]|uniref:Uncharacterized protein n=1 Tax=Artomyces pyxidatus TaxID=48021 RepID=A0ACB8SQH6_9AGAM|nr:hypothetical protein BV25DRAFT_1326016 [Artomyces pyxidatus]